MTEKEYYLYIGKIIKEKRKEFGYTQLEFCKILNIDRSYYSKIEKGTVNFTMSKLIKILHSLNLNLKIF